jgi:hypothetical protein
MIGNRQEGIKPRSRGYVAEVYGKLQNMQALVYIGVLHTSFSGLCDYICSCPFLQRRAYSVRVKANDP